MERLADIQVRIKNLAELADVVGAMRSLAAVRVQQARGALPAIRGFTQVIEGALARAFTLSRGVVAPWRDDPSAHDAATIAFTSEHGFVGAFNERILDRVAALPAAPGDVLLVVGSRGIELARARKLDIAWTLPMSTHGGDVPRVTRRITTEIYRRAGQNELRKVRLVYSKTASGAASEIVVTTLLPFDPAPYLTAKVVIGSPPLTTLRPDVLIDRLVDELVYAELMRAVMESLASANASRLATMESAHASIEKKLDGLSRDERRQRQDEITTELLDIVTGAEAVAGRHGATTSADDSARVDSGHGLRAGARSARRRGLLPESAGRRHDAPMTPFEAILDAFADAFNRKDAVALAALFSDDGDLVNILGARMRGRAGVEAGHAAHFARALSGNVLRFVEHSVRTPRPGLAIVHATWQRDRLPDAPDGSMPPGSGIFTLVLLETDGAWKIESAQNTQHAQLPR